MKIPDRIHATVPAIYRWHESRAGDPLREHLGASVIGRECERSLWLTFRWAEAPKFDGRMLRLFDSGKREERRLLDELRAIGCEVHSDDGTAQYRVSAHGGHFGGSMDGVVRGLPEAPASWHVLECKTANAKASAELEKKGLRAAKPVHFDQLQAYMALAEIDRGVYVSVCKDNDSIYLERVHLDKEHAAKVIKRAERIIFASEPPPRISEDADYYVCRYCEFKDICHGTAAPLVNCRTCAHSTPLPDGGWGCAKENVPVIESRPRLGCGDHRFIPILLEKFSEPIDADGGSVTYRNKLTGETFVNGELSSAEIRACSDKRMLGQERIDPVIKQLREKFGATYA